MSDFEILEQLINEKVVIRTRTGDHGNELAELIENDDSGKELYKVSIKNIPSKSFIVKTDKFPDLTNFFRNSNGECKKSDFVIISEYKSKKYIVFIEIKKTNDDAGNIVKQLTGAMCLLDYCRALVREFFQKSTFLNRAEYEYRFVAINKINIDKRPVYYKSDTKQHHDRPDNMLKISHTKEVFFKRLIGSN